MDGTGFFINGFLELIPKNILPFLHYSIDSINTSALFLLSDVKITLKMKFLENLDEDIKRSLLAQLRNLWTYSSTNIEGNSLTLRETAYVIEEGLTISGKPLKDHEEVVGHARAIEIIYQLISRQSNITEADLFTLHKAVQTEKISDIYNPIGAWKLQPNGTYAVNDKEQQVYIEYATPEDTANIMNDWLGLLHKYSSQALALKDAINAYVELHVSFVRIHPFFDGNGRIARLVSNIPIIKSGYPPILIPNTKRRDYIQFLAQYELLVGQPRVNEELLPKKEQLTEFKNFCAEAWKQTLELVDKAHEQQKQRTP